MSDAPVKEADAPLTPEQVQYKYSVLKQEYDSMAQKIAEMEGEKHEHELVHTALEPLEEDRKCFRLIGGVLVERSAKEVKPALKGNIEQIEKVIATLTNNANAKQKEIQDFIEKHRIAGSQAQKVDAPKVEEKKESKTTGVLA
eukprot:TRINITY_DN12960_c0_g1_i1.p2 TRINITY_DN12960_c0_g1~~TRINITY_DN12960_c0_g1_i1.p2  ORF type:complete len:143 (+),score=92.74 TRINITY_DN12960_c0_g1_i1:88-516(+)